MSVLLIFENQFSKMKYAPNYTSVIRETSAGQGIALPHPALKNYVKYFWYYHPHIMQRTSPRFRIIPSGCPGLIFHHFNGTAAVKTVEGFQYPEAFIHGQDTKPCINVDSGNSTIVSVRLYPTALKTVFNIDAHEGNDTAIPLNDVAGYNLTEQLLNARNIFEAIDIISEFLFIKISKIKFQDTLIEQSTDSILENLSSVTSFHLAKNLCLSQRQLQRRFKQFIGVSPETYIQILKFQKSINLIQRSSFEKLSDVAYELGYADQAHFIRHFKNFSGLRPKKAFKTLSKPGYGAPKFFKSTGDLSH